ncbi:4-hydroxy-tetrahydrodipicolinate reductase [Clostridium oryzae]|uniref:4-hydroxy-tetrahydrodipicolinate reductase n=1 Tax=Clostridium oryzae TaxID=1450648 RepID=A0A1V4IHP8_9CLOT|nr:4-hydroxy-tetrahydrodipicolinate reductase [Clostridium oryzae]OPJ59047.1 4-hydroxy-tetrahydrodipicolinate reductase [Clostridium oryzae]
MLKILLNGCNGRMGKVISNLAANNNSIDIIAGIDPTGIKSDNYPVYKEISEFKDGCDVILDFSNANSLAAVLNFAETNSIPTVLCTTGYNQQQLDDIKSSSEKVAIFNSSNMSIGIGILSYMLKKISPMLYNDFDIEIIEKHHNQKLDSPSGTAIMLANAIENSIDSDVEYKYGRKGMAKRAKNEIGVHAIRGGSIVGEHEIIFAGLGETIELKHTALSRDVFAVGAIKACKFIATKHSGLFNMDDLLSIK